MRNDNAPHIFYRFDFLLVLCALGLVFLGIAFIYSSGVNSDGIQVSDEWLKQVVWAVTGFFLMIGFYLIDYRKWKRWGPLAYIGILVLLLLVLFLNQYIKGSRAWLGIGGLGIQPSEFGKIATILLLALWFDSHPQGLNQTRVWLCAIAMTIIPIALISAQPDLGTAMVYFPILLSMAFVSGIRWSLWLPPLLLLCLIFNGLLGYVWSEYFLSIPVGFFKLFTEIRLMKINLPALLGLTVLSGIGWAISRRRLYVWMLHFFGILSSSYLGLSLIIKNLKEYQMMRLVIFLDPQVDPRGAGWHVIQSVTAIGSGGGLGKGFLKGTQSHYRYLPEQSTDFIFSILSEEIGFLGSLLVFALFMIILIRILFIAFSSRDRFGTYLAVGIAGMISFHIIQNIGMAIGVVPITGVPLFFLSYGGSSLWTAFIALGILLSINYRR